ncbi:DUF512 domain-containing protein [Capillibacterium thermochitinicola]|uniref:DUF512 domain-containing protein n=1 Tax=Capillibacterium thermochitinicola TaxID=2699427 RepID=UPI002F2B570A
MKEGSNLRREKPVAVVAAVAPHSLASRLGLQPGDRIVKINGKRIPDLITYQMEEAQEHLVLEVEKENGEYWEYEVEKAESEGLGLSFTAAVFDGIKPCRNRCLFCFVDQMPPGLRPSLYIKDDDYRLSFLQGSYITLTNLSDADWQRIQELRLSPLYISVHATDPEIRVRLLGHRRAGEILAHLRQLAAWGCHFHAQAVLCPGINDGPILEKTIADLGAFWPHLQTLAIVPVGLTRHRTGLTPLRLFTREEARAVLKLVHRAQERFLSAYGSRLVFAADEFYLQAEQEFPPLEAYEDLLQLENGVGLWPLFKTEFQQTLTKLAGEGQRRGKAGHFTVITGTGAVGLWTELRRMLTEVFPRIELAILPVTNHFFGPEVTVTGLVTGGDIRRALAETPLKPGTSLLLPQVMLRRPENDFLDGMTVDELRARVPHPVKVLPVSGEVVVKTLLGLEDD